MRELIKPALFMIARLGLFLAVLAWIVGQWWVVAGNTQRNDLYVQIDNEGWLGTDVLAISCSRGDAFGPAVAVDSGAHVQAHELVSLASIIEEPTIRCPGICIAHGRILRVVFLSHWLVITIFALFNGVLIWVYRKLGKELATDE